MTQAPKAMQQLATLLMTSKQADVPATGRVLQEWMATFAVAVQQARREVGLCRSTRSSTNHLS